LATPSLFTVITTLLPLTERKDDHLGRVIYLTGAPATGKSSICEAISELSTQVRVFSYSLMLRETVASRTAKSLDAAEIRRQSAAVVTREDVQATDELLVREVATTRSPTMSSWTVTR
jgi:adenylate kinase